MELRRSSPFNWAYWWKVVGASHGEPVKLAGRAKIGPAVLHATAIRVNPVYGGSHPRGPWKPHEPSLASELITRGDRFGNPCEWSAVEVEGYPGRWLIFLGPASAVLDPQPEHKPPTIRVPAVEKNHETQQDKSVAIPDWVPQDPNPSKQRGRDRAYRLGFLCGATGGRLGKCPYPEKAGSAGTNRTRWLIGHSHGVKHRTFE